MARKTKSETKKAVLAPSVAQTSIHRQRSVILRWLSIHQTLCFCVLSGLYVLCLYRNALRAPFVYDDQFQIVNNANLASFRTELKSAFLVPASFTNDFRGAGGSNYRPLFWLSLSLDRHFWGLKASGFHFTNILLHWLNGVLLFIVLRRTSIFTAVSATAAILWLGLPINSEPVAWVSGREYLLAMLFLLLACWSAVAYLSRSRFVFLFATFAFVLAALLSHESGIFFFPLAVFLAYKAKKLYQREGALLLSVAVAANLLIFLVRRIVGVHSIGGKSAIWPVGLAFWKYMLWMIAPIHMSMQRAASTPSNTFSVRAALALFSLLVFCGGIILIRRKAPLMAAGLTWTTVALLPFCGLVYIYQGMAERFEYFASAGVTLAVTSVVIRSAKSWRPLAVALVILWAAWGAWRLQRRVLDWCNPISLYESSLEATSDPMLFYNLGCAWRDKGDLDKALEEFQKAVALRPDYQRAEASIGQMLSLLHRPDEALAPYRRALALAPADSDTRIDFALTLEVLGEKSKAEDEFKKALTFAPKNTSALDDLGSLLESEGRFVDGALYFERAIQINPRDTTAYYNLGASYQNQGRKNDAVQMYQKLLQINPSDSQAVANLARLLRQ